MNWNSEAMFTGTLIEDLMATVERAEAAQVDETAIVESSLIAEGLIILAQESGEYDSKLFWQESGVA